MNRHYLVHEAQIFKSNFQDDLLRPLHDRGAKEKCTKILLIETGNAANNWLLASFLTKSSEILVIFTREYIMQRSLIIIKNILTN